jgi:hypothetical protein
MFWKKQAEDPEIEEEYKSERYYELQRGTNWDFKKGKELPYSLYSGYKVTSSDGTSYTHGWGYMGYEKEMNYVASGDKAWAERTAKHFKLEMPE